MQNKKCRWLGVEGYLSLECHSHWEASLGYIAQKKDNLWVKWVSEVYIKDTPWSQYEAPINASWAWKTVCQAKNDLNRRYTDDRWLRDNHFSIKRHYQALRSQDKCNGVEVYGIGSHNLNTG